MLRNVKVGDRVWSVRKGWLEVRAVHPTNTYAVELKDCGSASKSGYCSCTFSGLANILDKYPSFFLSEIKIEVPKRVVEKTLTVLLNYYPREGRVCVLNDDNAEVIYDYPENKIQVKCTGTYEVLE